MRPSVLSLVLSVTMTLAGVSGVHAQARVDNSRAPTVAADVDRWPLKLPRGWNFGETLGVAVNSKGVVVVLNHPGTSTSGPIYGGATTNLWEFDPSGQFVREIGAGVYGFAYGHSVRFDRYDNLWYVDKATNSVIKFDPQGRVLMNLGRRAEGYDSFNPEHVVRPRPQDAKPIRGLFNGPTDVAWDDEDNIFVSDGYVNSRVVKLNKYGDWLTSWGRYGVGGVHADENPGAFQNPHNMQVDRAGNVYVADRGNRRIHVFDKDGKFLHFLFLDAPYDKSHPPTLFEMPAEQPDETAPWALCITNTPTQYLYAVDSEPGRIYKMTLDGRIVAIALSSSGRRDDQLNWPHALACPSENVLWVADMNNWAIKKITLHPERRLTPSASRP
ncbi:MAG TPA: hypothetical protein VJP88_05095 [Caulobacteraceae bacterium]|nr:hypothetical protein [Caulobacteraceae bacterium]